MLLLEAGEGSFSSLQRMLVVLAQMSPRLSHVEAQHRNLLQVVKLHLNWEQQGPKIQVQHNRRPIQQVVKLHLNWEQQDPKIHLLPLRPQGPKQLHLSLERRQHL